MNGIRACGLTTQAVTILVLVCGCNQQSQSDTAAVKITGAGSTFAATIIDKWSEEFHKRHGDIAVGYDAVGSGDPEGEYSYPIVTFTWLLVRKQYDSDAKKDSVDEFVRWCLTKGQDYSEAAGNVRLAPHVARTAEAALDAALSSKQ